MFDNLNLRSKTLAVAAVPVNVLALVALWAAAVADEPIVAAVAAAGAVATLVVADVAANRHLARLAAIGGAVEQLAAVELPARIAGTHVDAPATPLAEGADADPEASPGNGLDELDGLRGAVAAVGPRAQDAIDRRRQADNKDLTNLVRGLARRHQSLLDRQIDHIDWLEDTEQNPDRLEQLFKLDHLATRLRRSSETVLVLAGSESTRPRGGPAPIATVLRVAMGETEAFTKIKLRAVDPVYLAGGPAFDVAHLVAELLENATQYSPPQTMVELHAVHLNNGEYQVTIVDGGFGMDAEQLAQANQLLADPPELDTTIGRSIGLIVVGRLAARVGARIELSPTPGSGVTATVVIPTSVVVPAPRTEGSTRPVGNAGTIAPVPAPAFAVPAAIPATPRIVDETGPAETGPDHEVEPAAPITADAPAESAPSARGRVTEDSSHALSKLLGLGETPGLAESNDWAAPTIDEGKGVPLTPRGSKGSGDAQAAMTAEADAANQADAANDGADALSKDPAEQTRPRRTSQARRRPGSRRRSKPSRTLADALPSGAAFDSGVESLLAPSDDAGTLVEPEPPASDELAAGDGPGAKTAAEGDQAAPSGRDRSRSKPKGKSSRKTATRAKTPGAKATATADAATEDDAKTGEAAARDAAKDAAEDGAPPADAQEPAVDEDWKAPVVTAGVSGVGLNRRQKGATSAPTIKAPLARASSRKPEEIRSMITDYRKGLKGPKPGGEPKEESEDQ